MKTKILILLAIMVSMVGFSQKNEIKAADKALKSGNAAEAKTILEGAKSIIEGAEAKYQAQAYSVLGNAYANLSEYKPAIETLRKVISIEEAAGKKKFTADAQQKLSQMTADLINAAVEDNNNKDYKAGAEKLYMGYKLSPKDTLYLY